MDTKEFWHIIDLSRKEANGDMDMQQELIGKQLLKYSPTAIAQFDSILIKLCVQAAYEGDDPRFAYNAKTNSAYFAICGSIMMLPERTIYASDNQYYGFVYWIIAQGQEVYASVLENPDYLATLVGENDLLDMELLGSVAEDAYQAKTGKSLIAIPDVDQTPVEEVEAEGDPAMLDYRPEFIAADGDYCHELKKLAPQLWAKFKPSV